VISKLHFISQPSPSHQQAIQEACEAGVKWVQLRVKNTEEATWLAEAKACKTICQQYGATFIVNDNIQIAKLVGADGVHLGKQDISPAEARKILGHDMIIGGTANTFEDIQYLAAQGVDYIGLGPFRFTSSKANLSPIVGLEGYQTIVALCKAENIHLPIIAIGGILVDDMAAILALGIHGIAVASLINESKNKKKIVSEINKVLVPRLFCRGTNNINW
jgi:thiamine-phosphate pyrophosphorylase